MALNRRAFLQNLSLILPAAAVRPSAHIVQQPNNGSLGHQLAQFPIDSRTVAEALDIPNYGETVYEKWEKHLAHLKSFS